MKFIKILSLVSFVMFSVLTSSVFAQEKGQDKAEEKPKADTLNEGDRLILFNGRNYLTGSVVEPVPTVDPLLQEGQKSKEEDIQKQKNATVKFKLDGQKHAVLVDLNDPRVNYGKGVDTEGEFSVENKVMDSKGRKGVIRELFTNKKVAIDLSEYAGIEGPIYDSTEKIGKLCKCLASPTSDKGNDGNKVCEGQVFQDKDSGFQIKFLEIYSHGMVKGRNLGRQMNQVFKLNRFDLKMDCLNDKSCNCIE